MPPRLLLDGEDLRALMLRVREEAGPDARIIKAERIRSGGFAGFFAKERYELTVEVPEVRPARRARRRPPRPGAPSPAGIDALLAAADAAEEDDGLVLATQDADAEVEEPTGPPVSTTGESFAAVLESVRQMVGAPEASPVTVGTMEGAPALEPGPLETGPLEPDPQCTQPGPLATDPEPEPATGHEPARAARPEPEPEPAPGPDPEPGPRRGSSVTALLELGIPARLLAGFGDPSAPTPLSVLVRRFDRPPSVRLDDGVLVVVGQGDDALRTATQMAHRAGLNSHEIVLAGHVDPVPGHGRRLQSVAGAARFRSRTDPARLTVVALGVSDDRDTWPDTARMLQALEPDQAWAAVDATRKPVEVRRWVRAVGSEQPFDALAACGTFDAQAPGTVLSLGLPVGWVDGLPATPVVWAAVLSERLADDARWD